MEKEIFTECLIEMMENFYKGCCYGVKDFKLQYIYNMTGLKMGSEFKVTWVKPHTKSYIIPNCKKINYLLSNECLKYYKQPFYSNDKGLFVFHSIDDYVLQMKNFK